MLIAYRRLFRGQVRRPGKALFLITLIPPLDQHKLMRMRAGIDMLQTKDT